MAPTQGRPALIPNAINEVIRYESPLRAFARQVRDDTEIDGTPIPSGSRLLILYASANRDEAEWDSPGTFDIRRDASRQIGFGNGTHACAGQDSPAWRRPQSCGPCWNASTGSK